MSFVLVYYDVSRCKEHMIVTCFMQEHLIVHMISEDVIRVSSNNLAKINRKIGKFESENRKKIGKYVKN